MASWADGKTEGAWGKQTTVVTASRGVLFRAEEGLGSPHQAKSSSSITVCRLPAMASGQPVTTAAA